MRRALLIAALTWAACSAVYWYLTHAQLDGFALWFVPIFAGFVMAVLIGTLRIAFAAAQDAVRLSSQSFYVKRKPVDGEVATIPGRIRAVSAPIRAPISGREAVLYSYEISHVEKRRNGVTIVKDYGGYGLTPAIIDSRHGPIRILGFPLLTAFDRERLEYARNVGKYIDDTSFVDLTGFDPSAIYREVNDVITDESGQFRKDWRMQDDVELRDEDFFEQVVVPGEQVCAIGRYSAERQALVADSVHPLQLLRGDPLEASKAMWQKARTTAILALVFAVVANAMLYAALWIHAHSGR